MLVWPWPSQAAVIDNVRGHIVLQVQANGEGWFIYPENDRRYYLGRPIDAFNIMRSLGLGISNADLAKIPVAGTNNSWGLSSATRNNLRGRILLQVEANGEAWYIYPGDDKRYYLGRPADAFNIMRQLGLGITNADLDNILQEGEEPVIDNTYQDKIISTSRGDFSAKVITLPRADIEIITDTANSAECSNDCPAKSLADYMIAHNALAGIHGSYFCPPDYSACSSKINTFNSPVFNTSLDKMIKEGSLPFHEGPLWIIDSNDNFHYFHRSIDFGWTLADYENKTGIQVKAGLANYPSLIENGQIVVHSEPIESAQKNKGSRGGVGYNNENVFLVIITSATVEDLAYVFAELGATYAMNLDGGGSSALYYNDEYKTGPGRLLPNAIIIKNK